MSTNPDLIITAIEYGINVRATKTFRFIVLNAIVIEFSGCGVPLAKPSICSHPKNTTTILIQTNDPIVGQTPWVIDIVTKYLELISRQV